LTPLEQWQSFIKNAHDGYISWEEFEEIKNRLEENTNSGPNKRKCPPREGPALLQSLAVCGICGTAMSVRYHHRRGYLSPDYCCQGSGKVRGLKLCQGIPGDLIDDAIANLLIESMTPTILEVALSVQEEIHNRLEEADKLRYRQVERAKYETELARRRYLAVDPHNRLVADELEADWNRCLKQYREATEEYNRLHEADSQLITEEQKKKVLALATDFPAIWSNERTPFREKKRMMRLLIDTVTLTKKDEVTVAVLFKGGFQKILTLPLMKAAWEEWSTPPEVVSEINRLLDEDTDGEVAALLNKRGLLSGMKKTFDGRRVAKIRRAYQIKSRYVRLKNAGLLTTQEICQKFELDRSTVLRWWKVGKIKGHRVGDSGRRLYEVPEQCNNMNKRGAV
jgi:excisionase family DNA binding protein